MSTPSPEVSTVQVRDADDRDLEIRISVSMKAPGAEGEGSAGLFIFELVSKWLFKQAKHLGPGERS